MITGDVPRVVQGTIRVLSRVAVMHQRIPYTITITINHGHTHVINERGASNHWNGIRTRLDWNGTMWNSKIMG